MVGTDDRLCVLDAYGVGDIHLASDMLFNAEFKGLRPTDIRVSRRGLWAMRQQTAQIGVIRDAAPSDAPITIFGLKAWIDDTRTPEGYANTWAERSVLEVAQ